MAQQENMDPKPYSTVLYSEPSPAALPLLPRISAQPNPIKTPCPAASSGKHAANDTAMGTSMPE